MASNRQLFHNHVAPTSPNPLALEIESAHGVMLRSPDGKEYIDVISGICVSSIGHNNPAVVEAVRAQAEKHMHVMVYGEIVQSAQVQYAELLVRSLPDGMDSVYFMNSGSEAVEGAMKLAKRATGRGKYIACRNAYHGSSYGTMSMMSNDVLTYPFKPLLPNVDFIDYNSFEDLQKIDTDTCCVLVETIQGEAGYILPDPGYLHALRKRCDETGALLILDEIQCGFGRTGKLWAFEHYEVKPDILASAKALGGGMPLGAFMASSSLMKELSYNPALGHITTFGGHPVCCAAGMASFTEIGRLNLLGPVAAKESLFRKHLVHEEILEVRGRGLMLAVQLRDYDFTQSVIAHCIEKGMLIDWFLFCDDALRISPPLIITEEEIIRACEIILESLDLASKS